MGLLAEKTVGGREYKVKDLSQADFGRSEIALAEVDMPGLMAYRAEFGPAQPLKGVRITVSLRMTIKTAVLIETLTALGAEVRSCSCNIFSTQDHVAAAIARDSAAVFAWKGETLQEYRWCTERALDWGPGGGPDLVVVDGGDVTLLIHKGVKAEVEFAKTGKLPNPESTTNLEFQMILGLIKESIKVDPLRNHRIKGRLGGVSEETTTGVKRLYQIQTSGTLLFPAINANDSVTKSKWDDLNGCRLSLPDGLFGVKYVMSADNVGEGCGYGDVGKPFRAVKPVMEALPEDVFGTADIFGDQYARKMKNNAIVCSIGHFDNFYIQGFEFKRQTDECVFPDTNSGIIAANLAEGRLMNLGCATDHPSFVLSCSFTKQVISQLELWNEKKPGKYEEKVYVLPKQLDEKVAALNLPKLGAKLTKLSPEQAAYINVPIEGPYEPAH